MIFGGIFDTDTNKWVYHSKFHQSITDGYWWMDSSITSIRPVKRCMFHMISYSRTNQLLDGMLKLESVSITIFKFMLQLIEILRMDVRCNHFLMAVVVSFYILNVLRK